MIEGAWTHGGFNLATQVRHQGNLDTKETGLGRLEEVVSGSSMLTSSEDSTQSPPPAKKVVFCHSLMWGMMERGIAPKDRHRAYVSTAERASDMIRMERQP